MTTQHTPGPWAINHAGSGRDGKFIYDEVYVYAPSSGVEDIAVASDIADPLGGDSMPNARLIAAAPELLEALISLLESFEAMERGEVYKKLTVKDARSAIKKATGETV